MSPNPHPIHAIIRCTVCIGLVIQQYQQRKESRREHKDWLQELGDQFGKFDKTFCELDEPEITLLPSPHHDPILLYSNPHFSAFWVRNAPNILTSPDAMGPRGIPLG
jgi:hypothetical protein